MVGKISVGGQGVDVRENGDGMGTGGGSRKVLKWWKAREIGGITQYFAVEKGLKWRKASKKARELGM